LKTRMEKLMGNGKDAFKVFKIGSVLFERAWFLRGFENMMTDFYMEPAFAHELLDRLTQRQLPAIELGLSLGADGLYLGDDYGCQMGLIMSPATWRTFVKPYLKRLMEPALKRSKPVFLHSCGNITEILPDLIDMGLSVYQTVQPEVYDLKQLKREFGRHLSFFGGIGTQSTLPHGTPAEVKRTVIDTCRILGENGGYICGPTHKATADTPVDNVLAMAEALQEA
jgi:uroporphyrinogen decarboxylase